MKIDYEQAWAILYVNMQRRMIQQMGRIEPGTVVSIMDNIKLALENMALKKSIQSGNTEKPEFSDK